MTDSDGAPPGAFPPGPQAPSSACGGGRVQRSDSRGPRSGGEISPRRHVNPGGPHGASAAQDRIDSSTDSSAARHRDTRRLLASAGSVPALCQCRAYAVLPERASLMWGNTAVVVQALQRNRLS